MKKLISALKSCFEKILGWFTVFDLPRFAIVSFILLALNFFPFITKLGFYLDDWPQLYSWVVRGLEGTQAVWMADSRWFTWWISAILFPIFGGHPLYWHLMLFFLRWLTVILFWLVFTRVWPDHKLEVTASALLFGIYPLFAQQSISITFTSPFVCYVLFFLSLFLMVQSYHSRKWFVLFTALGATLDLLNLLSYEYFLGLEFLRPVILLILISRESLPKSRKLGKTLMRWLPWFIVDFGYLLWRGFGINIPTLRSPVIFENLAKSPLLTLVQLMQTAVKDFVLTVFSIWSETIKPELFDFSTPSNVFAWGLAVIGFLIASIYLVRLVKNQPYSAEPTRKWLLGFLGFAALAVIFGAAPSWAIGRSISDPSGIWNDRFGIAAITGASMFLVGLILSFVKSTHQKSWLIIALFLALATGSNIRNTNEFRWSSVYQTRFFNQLVWRAPSIKANTAIFSGNELFPKMGVYPTAFALNLLYPSQNPMPQVDYWFYTVPHYFPNNYHDLDQGIEIQNEKWFTHFSSVSTDSLVIYWDYKAPSCMWVLDHNDRYNPFVSDVVKQILGATNLSRITDQVNPGYPPQAIFGPEAGHGWCYYYEKADLARQYGHWDEVVRLYEEAMNKGYNTNFGPELTPFIFGYALNGDVSKALELTADSKTMAEKMKPYLCDQWTAIHTLGSSSKEINEAYQKILAELSCGI